MTIFDTDFHCHILPGIDDGSSSVEESIGLLRMQAAQGVKTVVATPHFRRHLLSVPQFLENRQGAYDSLADSGALQGDDMPERILLGAEIALEHGLSDDPQISKLAIQEIDALLVEFPYAEMKRWMIEEIEEIYYSTRKKLIIAHLDRYLEIFSSSDYDEVLSLPNSIFQFNISAFSKPAGKRLVKKLMKLDYPILFGTDCHNLKTRKPNFDQMFKPLKKYSQHIDVTEMLR